MLEENQVFKKIQVKRARILDLIREFFKDRGFLEVQTPILVKIASLEPYLNPIPVYFEDEKNRRHKGYLITSPEYSLKKLLAAGFENIFEVTRAFRGNEAFGGIHNPEFSILEWYRVHSDYHEIIKDTENLIYFLAKKLLRKNYISFQGEKIDVSLPWPRMTVKQAFKKFSGIDLDKTKNLAYFKKIVRDKGYFISKNADQSELFYTIFLNEIEPRFSKNQPMIIYDYPLYQAALARRKSKTSFYAERFEVFITRMEICNGFSELLDWKEQEARFKAEQEVKKRLKKEVISIDESLINALKSDIPASAGNGLGVERLEMLLLDIEDINELLPFSAKHLFATH